MTMSTALLTDHYELTMLQAALRSGAADRRAVFEVFARRLPEGRRYGVVAGTGRVLDALEDFRFDDDELTFLRARRAWSTSRPSTGSPATASPATSGATAEGESTSPAPRSWWSRARFAEAVLLETLILSILNHDSAIASAASRMVDAAGDRPLHRDGLAPHPRAGRGGRRPGGVHRRLRHHLQPRGRAARTASRPPAPARTRSPCCTTPSGTRSRPRSTSLGPGTTLLVDTYDVAEAVRTAVEVAGTGARRGPASTPATCGGRRTRCASSSTRSARTKTRIIVTCDLDEYAIAALAAAPVDGYGVGTSLVTGSGARPPASSTSWWPRETPTARW